jgi:hypothetical protein|nr:MAG TPA: hypothetical protein [Caudoviricetes sp.]
MENLNQKEKEKLYSELYRLEDELEKLNSKQDMYDPDEEEDEFWSVQDEIDDVESQINLVYYELSTLND